MISFSRDDVEGPAGGRAVHSVAAQTSVQQDAEQAQQRHAGHVQDATHRWLPLHDAKFLNAGTYHS